MQDMAIKPSCLGWVQVDYRLKHRTKRHKTLWSCIRKNY